jgi:hypothetical protein
MDNSTRQNLENLRSADRALQNTAFFAVLAATESVVDWAYTAWDELVGMLRAPDNHERAIAAQVLCNLAKSDPAERMLGDFAALLNVTRDARFVTARHCLQALWKVGVAGRRQQQLVVDGLVARFYECRSEKNRTLIRYDILEALRKLYAVGADETIRETARELMAAEEDPKYQKKYATLWPTGTRAAAPAQAVRGSAPPSG